LSDLVGVLDKDAIILGLMAQIKELQNEIRLLKEQLVAKNSGNSSRPPSTEIVPPKRTVSLRRATGRKPGGQPGHKGNNLEMVPVPDVIDKRIPKYCNGCGTDLSGITAVPLGKRQLIDIPPIAPIMTEQRIYGRTCTCGRTTQGEYSNNANAPVGYGENIESMAAYLHARQYLPVDRMKELFKDILGTSISTGGISHLLGRFARKATPVHDLIKEKLLSSPFVGSDETGCKVNGKLHWFWTWQDPGLTYIAHSASRGKKAVGENFPQGFPKAILGSDAWKPQLCTPAKGHQLCTAHMLRELNYLKELYGSDPWAGRFSELLHRALKLRYKMETDNGPCWKKEHVAIMDRFQELLEKPPDPENKKARTFFKRILGNRDYIFVFLKELAVPPDNNSSERAIRNIKVKQKVSGQFKADHSATAFAKIRSVIDTTIKNSQNVLAALRLIARNEFVLEA